MALPVPTILQEVYEIFLQNGKIPQQLLLLNHTERINLLEVIKIPLNSTSFKNIYKQLYIFIKIKKLAL